MKTRRTSKPKRFTVKSVPYELERHITEVLDPDTGGGQEDSDVGRLVLAWNAAVPLTREFLPTLLSEARHLLSIIEDADEWQEYAAQARDRRELRAFIRRYTTR